VLLGPSTLPVPADQRYARLAAPLEGRKSSDADHSMTKLASKPFVFCNKRRATTQRKRGSQVHQEASIAFLLELVILVALFLQWQLAHGGLALGGFLIPLRNHPAQEFSLFSSQLGHVETDVGLRFFLG
jgi:hypothetical protein